MSDNLEITSEDISGGNLFMMCSELNEYALTDLPCGYHIRTCRKSELDIWKTMHFDSEESAKVFKPFMDKYFDMVYAPYGDEFWKRCMFLCDSNDIPIGTCFIWLAYDEILTVHWYKIRKEYEGHGLGRALLSYVMRTVKEDEFPVYLHTHPTCSHAIKLYTDFGFSLVTDEEVGYRKNNLSQAMPYLKATLSDSAYHALTFSNATKDFLNAVKRTEYAQF